MVARTHRRVERVPLQHLCFYGDADGREVRGNAVLQRGQLRVARLQASAASAGGNGGVPYTSLGVWAGWVGHETIENLVCAARAGETEGANLP